MLFRSDRKSTRLNSSHLVISYAVFCLKKKKKKLPDAQRPLGWGHATQTRGSAAPVPSRSAPRKRSRASSLGLSCSSACFFFFFNDTATTEIYPLSLHDALPISVPTTWHGERARRALGGPESVPRSEEHTSELQSPCNLVCRLLLEKTKDER